jgi:sugar-specific transcriptional regulator TrmB
VRRGFVERRLGRPVRPVAIEFEAVWEDAISHAVSRLDEIGDAIDGDVSVWEAFDLLQPLSES